MNCKNVGLDRYFHSNAVAAIVRERVDRNNPAL